MHSHHQAWTSNRFEFCLFVVVVFFANVLRSTRIKPRHTTLVKQLYSAFSLEYFKPDDEVCLHTHQTNG